MLKGHVPRDVSPSIQETYITKYATYTKTDLKFAGVLNVRAEAVAPRPQDVHVHRTSVKG